MKYLILIDQNRLSELDESLVRYLLNRDRNNFINLKPFLQSTDEKQIKDSLDRVSIGNKDLILSQILNDKRLVYLLNSEGSNYNTFEEILRLAENHPLMNSYLIKGEYEYEE